MHFGGALHISIGKGQRMQMDAYSSKVLMRSAGVVAWFLCSESRRVKSRWIQICLDYELNVFLTLLSREQKENDVNP